MFSVVTWNLREGGGDRLRRISEVLHRLSPDVAALQEATSLPNATALARLLDMRLVLGEAANGYHVAWLSRWPIRHSENHRLPGLSKTLLEIEVDWQRTPVRLFTTHLASRHDSTSPADEVALIVDRLHWSFSQAQLLVGDFNALAPDDPVGRPPAGELRWGDAANGAPRRAIGAILAAGYVDCYRAAPPRSPGYTYPSAAPWLRLDHIFASPSLATRLSACDVVEGAEMHQASDHLPVRATFREPAHGT